MNAANRAARKRLIERWLENTVNTVMDGRLGHTYTVYGQPRPIAGFRAGSLEINAGIETGRLLKTLSANNHAIARQLVPLEWEITGHVGAFMSGRNLRLEVLWPDHLAERDVRLTDVLHKLRVRPYTDGRWLAGVSDSGNAVTLSLDDSPHFLIVGTSGSGKSEFVRAMVAQLSTLRLGAPAGIADMILIDAKQGDSLGVLQHYPGVVGPLATDIPTTRAALGYAVGLMKERQSNRRSDHKPVVVFIEEAQELLSDAAIVEMTRQLVAQGRSARITCVLSTQHAINKSLGNDPTIKRNLAGRVCFAVTDYEASKAATGDSAIRADRLAGAGDSYSIVAGRVERMQAVWIPEREIEAVSNYQHSFERWPEFDPGVCDTLRVLAPTQAQQSNGVQPFSIDAEAIAVLNAIGTGNGRRNGRQVLNNALGEAGLEITDWKLRQLLKRGRALHDAIEKHGGAVGWSDD